MSEYKEYLNSKGQLHRDDGPAVIFPDGEQRWYINDKLHRKDGPAIIFSYGEQRWYINGKLHREDGPAIIDSDGEQCWFLNGVQYTEQEFYKELFKLGKITEKELFLYLI